MSAFESALPYEHMVENALRGVLRETLRAVIANGGQLPGSHHFYVAFRTDYPGVQIAPRIRAQYPNQMTIVIQHQFWDLLVSEESFSVSLTFGGIPETLVIPFAAVLGFNDPSVGFGLQFAVMDPEDIDTGDRESSFEDILEASDDRPRPLLESGEPSSTETAKVIDFETLRRK